MKRRPIKAGLVVAVSIAGVLLLGAVIQSSASSRMPSFQFLAGRSPAFALRSQDRPRGGWSQDFYSFAGDFETVCAAAQAELSALGYTQTPAHPDDFFKTREYRLPRTSSDGAITVRIMARAKLLVFSTPENSQYLSPDRYSYRVTSDWVSVEVAQQNRAEFWLWREVKLRAGGLLRRMGVRK